MAHLVTADVLSALEEATPTSKSVWLCLDGAVQAKWDECLERMDDAKNSDGGSLAKPELTAAVEEMEGLREQYHASGRFFRFERMPWEKKIALQADHPPRDDDIADRIQGVNIVTYYPALIRGSCVEVTDREGNAAKVPDSLWDRLLGTQDAAGALNAKQVDTLAKAAKFVNEGANAVPPSARSLLESQDFGASLAQPGPGTSPLDDSEDGNPPGSPSTSTTTTGGSSEA